MSEGEGEGEGSTCAAMLFAVGPLLEDVVCFSAFLRARVCVDVGRRHADPLSSSSRNGAAVEISEYTLAEERKPKTEEKTRMGRGLCGSALTRTEKKEKPQIGPEMREG